jgi:pimeloyl-ACP methyl ester carboxylesterase
MRVPSQPKFVQRIIASSLKNIPSASTTLLKLILPQPDASFLTTTKLQLFFTEHFRQSTKGFLKDAELSMQPWGFSLSDIRTPTIFWHGKADRNVSRQSAERMARELRDCSTNFINGEGHFSLIGKYLATILKEMEHPVVKQSSKVQN